MKYSTRQQLASLVQQLPAPDTLKQRNAHINARIYLDELAFRGPLLESSMIAANHWTFPLKIYREFYTRLGVLDCRQNAQGVWVHKLNFEGAKKVVKEVIESGDERAVRWMLNTPVYECYALALDKIFPEYIPGSDSWVRVMSLLSEDERKKALRDLRRDERQEGYTECRAKSRIVTPKVLVSPVDAETCVPVDKLEVTQRHTNLLG